MTFKWTYAFVALVIAATVVVAMTTGGFWGGIFSYGGGLLAILVGGALIYLASRPARRQLREEAPDATATAAPFVGYPKDQVLAIVESEDDALMATRELEEAGYQHVRRFAGTDGAAQLDSQGASHGVAASTERAIEQITSDVSDLEEYDAAVRRGSIVLGVTVPDGHPAHRAADILQRHRGHDVRYFGEMVAETFDADPNRTHAD